MQRKCCPATKAYRQPLLLARQRHAFYELKALYGLKAPSALRAPRALRALMPNTLLWSTLWLCLALINPVNAEEEAHGDHAGEHESTIELTADAQITAGIVVEKVAQKALRETLRVPGEVVINAYQSSRVTPRITAQVLARHVRLGDVVKAGQPLVTLSSVAMAAAQGNLIVADRDWQRVETLGRKAVSERRYTEAQVAQQQAFATVLAYGMTDTEARALLQSGDASRATGEFDLLAPQIGTVLQDDFIAGELIDPGRVLFNISDESILWVEAQTVPGGLQTINEDTKARVSVDGVNWFEGTVIQRHHRLDETTRTQGLRIEVHNPDDRLHPGQFVEAEITTGTGAPVLAIPAAAVTLIAGKPSVFKREKDAQFHAEAIETGATVGDFVTVRAGLEEGDVIAIDGVFYLKSLLLKSSLGEGHAH